MPPPPPNTPPHLGEPAGSPVLEFVERLSPTAQLASAGISADALIVLQLYGTARCEACETHVDTYRAAAGLLTERVGDRVLLSIHPDLPFCTSVPYLRAEAAWRQRCIRALQQRAA